MPNPDPNSDEVIPASKDIPILSDEERVELSLRLLKDLRPIREMADEEGHSFLSFLLDMIVMETQSIASGASDANAAYCSHCGTDSDGASGGLTT